MSGIKLINRKLNMEMFKCIDDTMYKLCPKCKTYKTFDNFSKNKNSKSGLKSYCKSCVSVTKGDINYYIKKHFNNEGLLKCLKCNNYKMIDDFHNDLSKPLRTNKSNNCKICESERKKLARITSKPKEDLLLHFKRLLHGCNNRVKGNTKRGSYLHKEMDIDLDYLIYLFNLQKGLCKISGIPMTFIIGKGKQLYNISIDRINCNKGYTKTNIQLVCVCVNIMRSDLDIDKLIELCTIISKYHEHKH